MGFKTELTTTRRRREYTKAKESFRGAGQCSHNVKNRLEKWIEVETLETNDDVAR
jgi:hypothetical protein